MDTQNNNPPTNADNTRPLGLGERPALHATPAAPSPAARANKRNQTISRVKRLVTVTSLATVLLGGGVLAELDLAKQGSALNVQTTSQPLYDPQDISTAATGSAGSATVPIVSQAQDTATATPAPEARATTAANDGVVAVEATATATEVPVAQATATAKPAAAAPAVTSKAPLARTRSSR